MAGERLLEVRDLYLYYATRKGLVHAVDGVSFDLRRGETLALVGESGCGKSSLAKALIRLLPRNVARYEGEIRLEGIDRNLVEMSEDEFNRLVRWTRISMVFQGALNSFNPVIRVRDQVAEPLVIHKGMSKEEAKERAKEFLLKVGIPEAFVDRYPFELSGGMRQRAMIAMALITGPDVVILDEPTSALDVLTQANIMNLLKDIKASMNLSFILITHDIALSSELADKVAVMYAGQVVEVADAETFYRKPAHPYSAKLMASVPTLRTDKKLEFIPGTPPSLVNPPRGCRFAPRCPHRFERCSKEPPIVDLGGGHLVKCWLFGGEGRGR